MKALPAIEGNHNLKNYEEAVQNFDWEDVRKTFSWHKTGKVNLAYEAIDYHAENGKGEQVALYYSDARRDESYTFAEMKTFSNKAANVLKEANVQKGTVSLSLCHAHLSCILRFLAP